MEVNPLQTSRNHKVSVAVSHRIEDLVNSSGTRLRLGGLNNVRPIMRKIPIAFIVCLSLLSCNNLFADRYQKAMSELANAKSQEARFYALNDSAKESFQSGHIDEARKFAKEILEIAPRFKKDWNYGNAIQDGNLVLGRIAVKEGRINDAKQFLLEAGKSKGSPQMDTFGPNMSLAKDLLEKGEKTVVLEYFELCRKFWEMHRGRLDEWSQEVKAGRIPNFEANLVY